MALVERLNASQTDKFMMDASAVDAYLVKSLPLVALSLTGEVE